jgi:hypothetical protein
MRINREKKKCFYKELNIFLELFPESKLCHKYQENNFKVKIRLTYNCKEYYLFMQKWDYFLKLCKKINDTFKVIYHEIVLDKIKFFIDIDINDYKKSQITKKVLKEYFKNKLNLEIKEVNIDLYKLNNIYRFIINSCCFLTNDHKHIYDDIKDILESNNIKVVESDYKYIPIEYFNDEKIFLTNIHNSLNYNLITNNLNMDIVFENNDNFILSDKCDFIKFLFENNIVIDTSIFKEIIEKKLIYIIKYHNNNIGFIIFRSTWNFEEKVLYISNLFFNDKKFYELFLLNIFRKGINIIYIKDIIDIEILKNSNNYCYDYNNIHKISLSRNPLLGNINNIKNNNNTGFLYIIQEREFINVNENIFKIGCTQDLIKRFKQYPKNSIIKFSIIHDNYKEIERKWINVLNNNEEIIKRKDIGSEYFQCNCIILINNLINIIND